MKRVFDFLFSILLFIFFFPIIVFFSVIIIFIYRTNPIHFSRRIGKNSKVFLMPKFITMKKDTPQIATHLLKNSDKYITKFGKFLRKTSLDEIPQLYSVIVGDMSLVGPRPALYNQYDLIKKRKYLKIDSLKPGITGYAQINGRDEISIKEKVQLDYFYFKNKSIRFDLKILLMTISKIIYKKNISH